MDRGTKRAAVGRRAVLMLPLAAWGGAVLLGGCGSGDPTYYTLQAWPGAPRRTAPTVVKVRMPTVAAFLDRDYIVSATDDYRLELAGNRAWAEPIAQMIGRVLSLDLAERLPDATVFSEDSAATRQADVVVSLDIGRFRRRSWRRGDRARRALAAADRRPGHRVGADRVHALRSSSRPIRAVIRRRWSRA